MGTNVNKILYSKKMLLKKVNEPYKKIIALFGSAIILYALIMKKNLKIQLILYIFSHCQSRLLNL